MFTQLVLLSALSVYGLPLESVPQGNVVGTQNLQGYEVASELSPTPEVGTENVTAHFCPFTCTFGNKTLCVPPPCPPPACVDPELKRPTDCCSICPHGINCSSPDGKPISYNHWRIVGSKNCTCLSPGMDSTCV